MILKGKVLKSLVSALVQEVFHLLAFPNDQRFNTGKKIQSRSALGTPIWQ